MECSLKEKGAEIERLHTELIDNKNALEKLKIKYRETKTKYKEKKSELRNLKEKEPDDVIKFGSKVVPKNKLSLCRKHDMSKYVGDLLDICFGRDTLAESVLKGTVNRSQKTLVLDADVIKDIIVHIMSVYNNVPIAKVKGAIRQKLNTCYRSKKKMKDINK